MIHRCTLDSPKSKEEKYCLQSFVMKALKRILFVICILLVSVDLGWNILVWNMNAGNRAAAKQFKVEVLHTNNVSGIGIVDVKTRQPLWIQLNYPDGKPSDIGYFFNGRKVMNVFLGEDGHVGYEVIFHERDGKAQAWYDHGHRYFTDRLFYDTNDDFSRMEVWCDQAWQRVIIRDGVKGLVANGEWHPLYFTNGMWTLASATTSSTNYFQ
jgi:hypothetical protein